jgi:hypothetical protein
MIGIKYIPIKMNKILVIMLLLLACITIQAQEYRKDTSAVIVLDRMSNLIGDMESCSFHLIVSQDVIDVDLGLVKYFSDHSVHLEGPDKMLVLSKSHKGHRGFWYNGNQLAYYSYTENNYGIIDAPDNIIATIDTVSKTYGIDFPAADFFYPTFTDDVIENFDDIIYAGKVEVEGQLCHHIIAKNPSMGAQVWLSDNGWVLPVKFVITYYDLSPNQQYEATFSGWQINPDLPGAMFEFVPPLDANRLTLMAK